ncbi:MAG: dihydroneopterin aldolase [Cyanobacteria bacterium P01_D01_bin.123]
MSELGNVVVVYPPAPSELGDCLVISNIECYGYTGYFAEERSLGQWFSVDLYIWTDLKPAAASDDLQDTLNYAAIVTAVQEFVQSSKFALLETLAQNIADLVLSQSAVSRVRVHLTKKHPPVPNFNGSVTLAIARP